MNPSIANLVYVIGIGVLFYLNRDNSVQTSKALWLPVIYLWILGSRPVSFWLGTPTPDVGAIQLEGSPIDEIFFGILLIMAIWVLVGRGSRVRRALIASWPILIYFAFCLTSILWSDFPGVASKRWTKSLADLVMVLVVITDEQPTAALSRLFSRVAFVLAPLDLLFIKYYPFVGRTYDPWTGRQMFTGLTGDKNLLGVSMFVLLIGALWRTLRILRSEETPPNRGRVLIAQGVLIAVGSYVLVVASSTTSIVCCALGAFLILATSLRFMRRHAMAVHGLVLLLVVGVTSILLLGGGANAAKALGKDPTLTGRTEIWADVIPLAPSPLVGAGFESFWLSQTVHDKLWGLIPGLPLNEAHDGYIEVYLELGWVGICLIGFILIDGYRRAVSAFRRAPTWGGLLIAYVVCATVYGVTEAGFRMMFPMWIFLLFSFVASSSIVSGLVGESSKSHGMDSNQVPGLATNPWVASQEGVRSI